MVDPKNPPIQRSVLTRVEIFGNTIGLNVARYQGLHGFRISV